MIGEQFKQARAGSDRDLKTLSDSTKIREDYLQALEEERYDLLPERLFTRSYIQRYARELGIDPAPLLAEYDQKFPNKILIPPTQPSALGSLPPTKSHVVITSPTPSEPSALGNAVSKPQKTSSPDTPLFITSAITGILLLAALGWWGYTTYTAVQPAPITTTQPEPAPITNPEPTTVRVAVSSTPAGAKVYIDNGYIGNTPFSGSPVTRRESALLRLELEGYSEYTQTIDLTQDQNLSINLTLAPPPPVTETPSAVPANPNTITIRTTSTAWVRVRNAQGTTLSEGTYPAGKELVYNEPISIRTGAAGAVEVSVGGQTAEPMGAVGQVITRNYP